MRELSESELDLISGGYSWDDEDIVVTGTPYPPSYPPYHYPPVFSPGGYTPSPPPPPTYTGGGGAGPASPVADHPQDCSTDDGAAVQIAKHVMGNTAASGPPNPVTLPNGKTYQDVEFGAVIVRNANGSYGALNDKIYSSGMPGYSVLPSMVGTDAVGLWHNHRDRGGDYENALDSYPSLERAGGGDWVALAALKAQVAPNNPAFDPSLYITGPDGVTREFKLSERAHFEGLTDDQMGKRDGLDGRSRSQSCS